MRHFSGSDAIAHSPPITARSLTVEHRRLIAIATAGALDLMAVAGTFLCNGSWLFDASFAASARMSFACALAALPFALLAGALRPVVLSRHLASATRAGLAILCGGMLLFVISLLIEARLSFDIGMLAMATLTAGCLVAIFRLAFAIVMRKRFWCWPEAKIILHEPAGPHEPVSRDAVNVSGLFDPESPTVEDYDRLARMLRNVDTVVVLCTPKRRRLWTQALGGMNVAVEVCAPELSDIAPIGLGSADGEPTLRVTNSPLSIGERIAKRVFDLAAASAAIIFLSPLFVVVALAVKLDTPGPILFLQPRIGRRNRIFLIYKFRSMTADGCDTAGGRSTSRDDKRVTRVGRFIRKTSLDELPQLFNVLLGHMSIVGPRPHAISSTAAGKLFWEVDDRYWSRHACKPGITGLAQINGYRGATERSEDLINRVSNDLQYLSGWSFAQDIKIILQTCRVLVHHNAY